MSTVLVVVIVIIVILAIGAAGFMAVSQGRRKRLRTKFGPEYDRAVQSHESTREAEQELLARQKRHDELEIKELDPEARKRHRAEWQQLQERFVDAPESAVTEADHLLVLVMGERGYPTEGYEQQVTDLSVEHAGTIDRYRTAHDIGTRAEAKQASTEDLRQAMVHYRALFTELLGEGTGDAAPRDETAAEARTEDTRADARDEGVRTEDTRGDVLAEDVRDKNVRGEDVRAETDAERDAGAEAAADRDVNAEANGRGRRAAGRAESETRTGEPAGRRGDAGDEGV